MVPDPVFIDRGRSMAMSDDAVRKLDLQLGGVLEREVVVLVRIHSRECAVPQVERRDYVDSITYRTALIRQQKENVAEAKKVITPKLEQLGLTVLGGPNVLLAICARGPLRAILEAAHLPEVISIMIDGPY